MKKEVNQLHSINSISELHEKLGLAKPDYPLLSVIDFQKINLLSNDTLRTAVYNFYSICIIKDFKGKVKYGQSYYDFDEGMMTFFSPNQIISAEIIDNPSFSGWWLVIHPDLLRNYALSRTIKEYGFFSYAVNEALHLSEKEEGLITSIIQNISREYALGIDHYTQDIIVSHIELLLNYSNRFYNRQFLTRKHTSNDLLVKIEALLDDYFNHNKIQRLGLPTVHYISDQLKISSNYLSDLLRAHTGQTTQQHIHNKLIEKAKDTLSTTGLSVSEIAYLLGFEHPQSFSKLFKSKTNVSPLKFRSLFN